MRRIKGFHLTDTQRFVLEHWLAGWSYQQIATAQNVDSTRPRGSLTEGLRKARRLVYGDVDLLPYVLNRRP